MALIKTAQDIANLRISGRVLGDVLDLLAERTVAGAVLSELDSLAEEFILAHQMKPSFKGYAGFPATVCISVEDQVVHSIPTDRVLQAGEIVSYDCGVWYNGVCTDACITVGVGKIAENHRAIMQANYRALYAGIKRARAGAYIGDIGFSVEKSLKKDGFFVIKEYTGHGVGHAVHEKPYIPNYGQEGTGLQLQAGMVLAIEPIVAASKARVLTLADEWTTQMSDHSLACQYEHTVVITDKSAEIITRTKFEQGILAGKI